MQRSPFTLLLGLVVAFDLVFLAVPTLVVVVISFTSGNMVAFPPEGFSLRWYGVLLSKPEFLAALGRSLWVGVVCTALAVPAGTAAALALARWRIRYPVGLQLYLLLPFTVPLVVSGIALMLLFGRLGMLGQVWPVGLAACVINLPFMIWAVAASVNHLDPDLENAAMNCGAAPTHLLHRHPAGGRTGHPYRCARHVHPRRQRVPGQPHAGRRANRHLAGPRLQRHPQHHHPRPRRRLGRLPADRHRCDLAARPPRRPRHPPRVQTELTKPMINLFELGKLDPAAREALLLRTEADLSAFMQPVARIIDRVRDGGDAAIAELAREIDKVTLDPAGLEATEAEFAAADRALEQDVKDAIAYAVDNIRRFHERQKPEDMWLMEIRKGMFAGERWSPIGSVACYVPRGKGAFPSVMMMTIIPAVVAGVAEIVVLTPPTPEGGIDAASLYAARMAGVRRVFRVGGAVAVAAAAHGTATIPKVAKIVGPGSPWVVAAKRHLADRIDTGLPAGPSESIVLADATANPDIAALDLLIEAEHGADSSAYLVTDSREVAERARARLPELIANLGAERRGYVEAVLGGKCGGIVLAPSWEEAVRFTNDYAAEHLLILSSEPMQHLGAITDAGEILLGENTPMTIANFCLGPDCVLPTAGWARTFSALGVQDFMKRTSLGHITRAGFAEPARHAAVLARYEGFEAHAQALGKLRDSFRP
ncbi:MAG: histidinol dehydrogenase [Geminicoccaceae bacterium]